MFDFSDGSLQERFDNAVRLSILDLDASGVVDPQITGVVAVGAFTAAIMTVKDTAVALGAAMVNAGQADPEVTADKVAFICELLSQVNALAAAGAHRYLHGTD